MTSQITMMLRVHIASHVGAFEVNRLSYNLQDWELKWLADRGGEAGIIFIITGFLLWTRN